MPVSAVDIRRPVADVAEDGTDADRRRPEVEGEHHDPEDDQDALRAGAPSLGHSSIVPEDPAIGGDGVRSGADALSEPAVRICPCAKSPTPSGAPGWAPGTRSAHAAGSVAEAVEQMTCLHATEPASVYLSVVARADASRVRHRPGALRRAVRGQAARHAAHPVRLPAGPAAGGVGECLGAGRSTSCAPASPRRSSPTGWPTTELPGWSAMFDEVLRSLRAEGPSTTAELRERIPALAQRLELAPGKAYGGSFPIAPRLLGTLAVGGQIVRGANNGDWHVSRPRWDADRGLAGRAACDTPSRKPVIGSWSSAGCAPSGRAPRPTSSGGWGRPRAPYAARWGSSARWRSALRDGVGYLLPDDLDDVPEPEPWAALLPVLDPTMMGWKQRGFYLDEEDVPHLFDTNGNAGTTAWWDGPDRRLLGPGRRRRGLGRPPPRHRCRGDPRARRRGRAG